MKSLATALAIVALAIVAAACSSTAAPATGAPSQPAPSGPAGDSIVIVARDLAFTTTSVTVKAGVATPIVLDNQENVPHNIAVRDAAGGTVFKGDIVTAKQITNEVPALAAGSYTFWCEIHPDMQGTLEAR